jgi:polysaccharide biosynthesis protein PslA
MVSDTLTLTRTRPVRAAASPTHFTLFAPVADLLAILTTAVATGFSYHMLVYSDPGNFIRFIDIGLGAGLIYVLPFLFRGDYRVPSFLDGARGNGRVLLVWSYTFLCLGLIGFLTKTTQVYSRGWLVAFYLVGLFVMLGVNTMLARALPRLLDAGRIAGRRVMVVGTPAEVGSYARQIASEQRGLDLIATEVLPQGAFEALTPALRTALAEATSRARLQHIDDVVIALPWLQDEIIREIVNAFLELPVSIYAGFRFGTARDKRVSRFSRLKVITIASPPLGPWQLLTKRVLDVLTAGVALVLLAPLFAVIGIMIKLSSPGPVFFLQRRSGYNGVEFRIFKFRTMVTLEDGDSITQASKSDPRVTKIGRVLRRCNLDELPQLLNVLRGEMSMVGPRPHAVAHDYEFARQIGSYARRLNVPPGITGWAQVNGFRGPTKTTDVLRSRIEHDLYYIENWSVQFDLYIVFLTLFSPNAYANTH